jgi:two-component system, NtrC family, nitrogen regulation response regulator GlnG
LAVLGTGWRRVASRLPGSGASGLVPALSILHHRELRRVGECAHLWPLRDDEDIRLSRLETSFLDQEGVDAGPLADPYISRAPVVLRCTEGGLELACDPERVDLRVDGAPVSKPLVVDPARLDPGLVLELADEAALLLHLLDPSFESEGCPGMVGHSEALRAVRSEILRVAELPGPVLIVGEPGVGKRIVARAIHNRGRRRGPYLEASMASLDPGAAMEELFGVGPEPSTAPSEGRRSVFDRAGGGTLFLDEVAGLPAELQHALLRALDAVGLRSTAGGGAGSAALRLIAATSADLLAEASAGRLLLALFYRLSGHEIFVPPLRERLIDVPLLFTHFVREKLLEIGEEERLKPPCHDGPRPWLSAAVVARLVRHSWPGNVRELKCVAHKLAISARSCSEPLDPDVVGAMLSANGLRLRPARKTPVC